MEERCVLVANVIVYSNGFREDLSFVSTDTSAQTKSEIERFLETNMKFASGVLDFFKYNLSFRKIYVSENAGIADYIKELIRAGFVEFKIEKQA